jgi:predicted transcriptional regulator
LFESRTGMSWNTVAGPIERLAARGLLIHSSDGGESWGPTELGQRFLNDLIAEFLPARPVV